MFFICWYPKCLFFNDIASQTSFIKTFLYCTRPGALYMHISWNWELRNNKLVVVILHNTTKLSPVTQVWHSGYPSIHGSSPFLGTAKYSIAFKEHYESSYLITISRTTGNTLYTMVSTNPSSLLTFVTSSVKQSFSRQGWNKWF